MKKFLLLFFVFFGALSVYAQDALTIDDTEIFVVEPDLSNVPIKGITHVRNNTDATRTYVWTRENVAKPDEWEISICDNNLCYFHTVNSQPFDLMAGGEGLVSIQVNPNGVSGEGEVRIDVVDDAVADSQVTVTFYLTLGTVSTSELELRTIKAFPNPAHDIINITDSQNGIAEVTFYNVIGRPLKTFGVAPNGQYDVSNLATGLYLVQLKDAQGGIIRTIRMHKN